MNNKTHLYSVIAGTGSYIPENKIAGDSFLNATFYENGLKLEKENSEIIQKFTEITEIIERRYVDTLHVNSTIACYCCAKSH